MDEIKDIVKAKEFQLVDDEGNTKVTIGLDDNGNSSMKFMDKNQKVRVSVGSSQNGPASISLSDSDGETRILSMVAENGSSYLFMYDRQGVTRVQVETGSKDITTVILGGKDKKPLIKASLESQEGNYEKGSLSLYDSMGKLLHKSPNSF